MGKYTFPSWFSMKRKLPELLPRVFFWRKEAAGNYRGVKLSPWGQLLLQCHCFSPPRGACVWGREWRSGKDAPSTTQTCVYSAFKVDGIMMGSGCEGRGRGRYSLFFFSFPRSAAPPLFRNCWGPGRRQPTWRPCAPRDLTARDNYSKVVEPTLPRTMERRPPHKVIITVVVVSSSWDLQLLLQSNKPIYCP